MLAPISLSDRRFPCRGEKIPGAGDKKFPAPDWREIRAVYRDELKVRRE
jgi:hypothetical protein